VKISNAQRFAKVPALTPRQGEASLNYVRLPDSAIAQEKKTFARIK
jgi:hypothetical protein